MKKLFFTLFVLIAFNAVTFASSGEIAMDLKLNEAGGDCYLEAVKKAQPLATRCCVRRASDENGQVWTAKRCVTHEDTIIAYGAACALAQADANKAKETAIHEHSVPINPGVN